MIIGAFPQISQTVEQVEEITQSGQWIVPDGIQIIDVFLVSGGDGGSNGYKVSGAGKSDNGYGGNGGASGKVLYIPRIAVRSGDEISVVIGAGGEIGKAGEKTVFGDYDTDLAFGIKREKSVGGAGGNVSTHTGGLGAIGVRCPLNDKVYASSGCGGGAGNSSGSVASGFSGGVLEPCNSGGNGGYSGGSGAGGPGGNGEDGTPNTGNGGGGGGGCGRSDGHFSTKSNGSGGNGGSGIVIIRY